MPWTAGLDGCPRWVADATLRAWREWRIGHTRWMPLRNPMGMPWAYQAGRAALGCAKPLALALPLVTLPAPAPSGSQQLSASPPPSEALPGTYGVFSRLGSGDPWVGAGGTWAGLPAGLPAAGEGQGRPDGSAGTGSGPAAVPEPPGWLVLLPAVLLAAWLARRRP